VRVYARVRVCVCVRAAADQNECSSKPWCFCLFFFLTGSLSPPPSADGAVECVRVCVCVRCVGLHDTTRTSRGWPPRVAALCYQRNCNG